jgi:hypothetical protein
MTDRFRCKIQQSNVAHPWFVKNLAIYERRHSVSAVPLPPAARS